MSGWFVKRFEEVENFKKRNTENFGKIHEKSEMKVNRYGWSVLKNWSQPKIYWKISVSKSNFSNVLKTTLYHFGESGKVVEILDEIFQKITSVSRNQQQDVFGWFSGRFEKR